MIDKILPLLNRHFATNDPDSYKLNYYILIKFKHVTQHHSLFKNMTITHKLEENENGRKDDSNLFRVDHNI